MQVITGVNSEQDIAQRRLELSGSNVDLIALMDCLQGIRQARPQQGSACQSAGVTAGAHHRSRGLHGAA
ncbi:hypothetical protein ES708_17087 [subsurface metagenome]